MTNYHPQITNYYKCLRDGVGDLSFKSGFTLLEMVISFGIFSVLIVASIGITLGISNAQIKASNIQTTLDNIRFSLELITKEMRTGSGYTLTTRCGEANEEITFTTSLGETRTYFLDGSAGNIKRVKTDITSAECTDNIKVKPFTSDDVMVERFSFSEIEGNTPGGIDGQPRVTISLRVKSKNPKHFLESSMDLQTTVVQRLRDL